MVEYTPSPNAHILLPPGIAMFGVEDRATKLANAAYWTGREGRVELLLKHGLVVSRVTIFQDDLFR